MSKRRQIFNAANILAFLAGAAWPIGRSLWHGGWHAEIWNGLEFVVFGVLLVWLRHAFTQKPFFSIRYGYVRPTPAWMIGLAGWFFILAMPIIMGLLNRQGSSL